LRAPAGSAIIPVRQILRWYVVEVRNKEYEVMVLFNPETQAEEIEENAKKVEELIAQYDGRLYRTDKWAKRHLAYPVDRFKDGLYVIHRFRAPKEIVPDLNYLLKYHPKVLRFLVTDYTEKVEKASRRKARTKVSKVEAQG